MNHKATKIALAVAVFLAPVVYGYEPPKPHQLVDPSVEQAPFEISQDRGLSLDQAVNLVRSRVRGKVVRSETVNRDGKRTHLIRVLTDDGHMRTYRVDAKTGRMR